jgi:hypothetical protein
MTGAHTEKREHALGEAVRLITNLLRCVLWLIGHGVYVIGFRGWRSNGVDHVVVQVPPSPYLYHLFQNDCSWQQRRQEGCLTIFTWFSIRFGIRIEWEETCAFPVF